MHGLLSALMFYIVDCIQRRYMSRLVVEVSGILQVTPNLAIMIILMCVLFSGLPGTLKFSCEFFIFSGLIEASAFSTFFILIVANVLGLIGFSKS
jgi:NADH:ubiquinone oxidoreductase subunit 4 (subunit M)